MSIEDWIVIGAVLFVVVFCIGLDAYVKWYHR